MMPRRPDQAQGIFIFHGHHALHGAYWHDKFGRPKSHGCINLSPEDARRLFFCTEPAVPPGWHGAARSLTRPFASDHSQTQIRRTIGP